MGEIFEKDRGKAVRDKNKAGQFRKEISPWHWGNVFRDYMRGREITRIIDYKTNEKSLFESAKIIEQEAEDKPEEWPVPRQMPQIVAAAGAPAVTYLSHKEYCLK